MGEQQKLKEFDLSNPLVQAKLKERYGKNIPLEETVVSPQAVFDAPQLTTVAKEWPLFSWQWMMKKIIPAVVCLLLCSCTTFPQAVAPVNGDASN